MRKDAQAPKLRQNMINALARKPGESTAQSWLRGPGNLAVTSVTHKGLVRVAHARGLSVTQVTFVRVANVEGEMRIWIYPVDESDPQRIPLQRYRSKFHANLSQPLLDWKMSLPTGQRNRYDVRTDELNESPVGPALYFDINQPLETKWEKPRSKAPARPSPGSQAKESQGDSSAQR